MKFRNQILLPTLSLVGVLALTACDTTQVYKSTTTNGSTEQSAKTISKKKLDSPEFYVVSNKADGNSIYRFASGDEGHYSILGEYNTGGVGTGDLEVPALQKDETHPLANGDDPLISAYALSATADGKHIVVVNPGNATVSLMEIKEDGTAISVNTAQATDKFPISVAIHDEYVVVASVGEDNMKGSIGLFKIINGKLYSIENGRRDLKARPSTVRFSSNGKFLIVDELVTGKIKSFSVIDGVLSNNPVSTIDSPKAEGRFQAIPVGLDLKPGLNGDILIVSEARFLDTEFGLREGDGSVIQSPLYSWQTGSLSSYKLASDGQLSLISGDVLTGQSIEGGEIANCWVVLSPDGKTLWAANALSSSISSFNISDDGTATIKNVTAYKDDSEELFFSDLSVSSDGQTLYQLIGNKGKVAIFDILPNDDLELRQMVGGMPELGTYGLQIMP